MTHEQRYLPIDLAATPKQRAIRSSRARLALAICLLLGIAGRVADAQFSGPALGIDTQVNPPITITTDRAILFPPNREIFLGNGDVLAIHLFGTTDYNPTVRVNLDGTIQLPLIGNVTVEGLTLHQTQDLIAEKLVSAGMFRDPQVTIQVLDSPNQIATIIGEIHGIVPILGERRLYDVLVAAGGTGGGPIQATTVVSGGGGLPPSASHIITIHRYGVTQPIIVDLGTDPSKSELANIPIFARDTIVVPRVGVVYVLGAFKNQGAIPLQQNSPITLMKVAALAGGDLFEGKPGDLRIIRTTGLTRQVVRVDLKKIKNGQAPDPVLQAEDIVFLPTSPMKAAISSGGISTLLGIASLLVLAANQ
jgi:polysaccharide export outer membrane protein